LDVGCGVGGTSLYLANRSSNTYVTGISLSPKQVEMATENARNANLSDRVSFRVMDGEHIDFDVLIPGSFDVVWISEGMRLHFLCLYLSLFVWFVVKSLFSCARLFVVFSVIPFL
jgi:cyclopropane fatty-acyl-phospholipid synthase-like methyltransferase